LRSDCAAVAVLDFAAVAVFDCPVVAVFDGPVVAVFAVFVSRRGIQAILIHEARTALPGHDDELAAD
jgi:hypothetical protein